MPLFARAAAVALVALSGRALARAGPEIVESFDFVIVGGGVAGTILANRLSASGEHSVLLLNIAGAPPEAYSSPVVLSDEFITDVNLTFTGGLRAHIEQPGYKAQPHFSTSETGSSPARWLGGSSLVGLSLYLRDHPEAIDTWGEGWSWEELKPYFRRAERLEGPSWTLAESDYGTEGPYDIQEFPAYVHPLTWDFVRAAKRHGLPYVADLNTLLTEKAAAVGITPVSQHADGTKTHAYDAYLKPALGRKNLVVREGARADKLIIYDDKCHGVVYKSIAGGTDHAVLAEKEVVLSSGYVYTPRLLFLSGVGDKKELEKEGVKAVKHLPALGKHLTAARYSPLSWETPEPTLARMVGAPISPNTSTPVPECYGSAVSEATARFRSAVASLKDPESKRPDVIISFQPLFYKPEQAPLQYSLQGEPWPLKTNAYSLLVTLGETKAQGHLKLSGYPDVSPVMTHEPLTHPEDLERAAEAVRMARAIGGSTEFQDTTFIENGAGSPDMWSAVYDGRGTCRMGKSHHDSVVDFKLRVHGIQNLRVADGSVIPQGSPYLSAPEVIALAERASDLILDDNKGAHHGKSANAATRELALVKSGRFSIKSLAAELGPDMTLVQAIGYMSNPGQERAASLPRSTLPGAAVPVVLVAALAAAAVAPRAASWARKASGGPGAEGYLTLSA